VNWIAVAASEEVKMLVMHESELNDDWRLRVDYVIVLGQHVNERHVYHTAVLWKGGKENFTSTRKQY
jgi:hypothetical protein